MSNFETLTVLAAIAALIISLVTLIRARKVAADQKRIAEEQLELQRVTAELAKKQLELILVDEASTGSARVTIDIKKSGRGHKFIVSNIGPVPAHNVSFELHPHGGRPSPLVESHYNEVFPVDVLSPGSSAKVLAAFHLGSATGFDVTLRWQDPDGNSRTEKTFLSL